VAVAHNTVIVYRSRVWAACVEHGLVLEAASIAYQVQLQAGEHVVLVAAVDEARALGEIAAYDQENRDQPPPETSPPLRDSGWTGVLVYVIVLLLFTGLQQRHMFGADWFAAGRMNAGLVRAGQWWRCVTALGLHLDIVHLLGNLVVGGLFGLLTGRLLGSGLAWLSILAAGALGNGLNACLQPAGHTSIGASTALFGALGILAAYEFRRRHRVERRWNRRLAPIAGAAALLALMGTGGEHTDVIAHLAGFAWGLAIGALCGAPRNQFVFRRPAQLAAGLLALGVFAFAWASALIP
jgi:membrane associated rhomboid family serine protease